MRYPGSVTWVALSVVLGMSGMAPRHGEGQIRSITGSLRVSFNFDDQRVGGSSTQRSDIRQDYSLGVQGLILDPRLATFDVTGTFGATDPIQSQGSESRVVSGGLNLNILPTSRTPVTLRHFQSHGWNGTTSDVMNSGLVWRVSHPLYPTVSLSLERTAVETRGSSSSETTFLSGILQATHRLEKLDLFGEVGVRRTEDSVRDTTTRSQFASVTGTYNPTAATNLQAGANYFQQGDNLSAGTNAALTNRPDPSLTRSANLSARSTRGDGTGIYSVDAGGSLSKSYLLAPALQAFLTGSAIFATDVVAEGSQDGFLSLTTTGGGGVSYSGFRYVAITADSSLATLYEDDRNRGFGVRGTAHLGLTGQNLGRLALGGDYTFRVETGVVNARDHIVSLRAALAAPVRPTLTLEAFTQSGMFIQEGGSAAAGSHSLVSFTGGGRATYTGIPFVTWNLISQYRINKSGVFDTEAVSTSSILTYTPYSRLQAILTANREDTLTTGETRHSVLADVAYRIGATTLSLSYTFDILSGRGDSSVFQRLMLTLTRPFGIRVR